MKLFILYHEFTLDEPVNYDLHCLDMSMEE